MYRVSEIAFKITVNVIIFSVAKILSGINVAVNRYVFSKQNFCSKNLLSRKITKNIFKISFDLVS